MRAAGACVPVALEEGLFAGWLFGQEAGLRFYGLLIEIGGFLVGDEGAGKVVELCEVGAEDERRTGDCPECKFSTLFVLRVGGRARLILAGVGAEEALGEHIGVGPVSGFDVAGPLGDAVEFVAKAEGVFGWRFLREGPSIPSDRP